MEHKYVTNGFSKRPLNNNRPNHITLNGANDAKKLKTCKFSHSTAMKQQFFDPAALEAQKKALPIYDGREDLIQHIQQNDTLIVMGETACGKTTQLPQYIYEEKINGNGVIGITQPRRVAATTVASRVAQEMRTPVGDLVGYRVRFEDITSSHTKVKFLTDGMLLREAVLDANLLMYTVIILDEAHERTVHTDILFGIVKKAQAFRKKERLKPLKVIVMSATMDLDHFSEYFNSAPIIYIEGRQHDVQVFGAVQPQEDYFFSSLVTIFQIHRQAPANEDILVFLTGQEEIEAAAQSIRSIATQLEDGLPPLKVCSLYASIQPNQMQSVFRPTPSGYRKIVLSTNVAETSVTIPGIKFVIDTGRVKTKVHHPGTGLDSLKVQMVSQSQAWQRTGRAGRESAGVCYRTYTKEEFAQLRQNTQPEILRCNIAHVLLQLFALGLDVNEFDFIDRPSPESLKSALQELKLLGAIDSLEKNLTTLGTQMAKFPIDPRYSKILLSTEQYECGEEIITLIAILSGESIFLTPPSKKTEAREAHQKFVSSAGDHVTLVQVYRAFNKISSGTLQHWCHENFLNMRHLQYASNVRKQLSDMCRSMEITLKTCGQDFDKVRKCLVTGLFTNVAELQREKQYVTIATHQKVTIHPTSVLSGSYPNYVIFSEMVDTSKCYIRNLSLIDSDWLTEIAPEYFRHHRLSGGSQALVR